MFEILLGRELGRKECADFVFDHAVCAVILLSQDAQRGVRGAAFGYALQVQESGKAWVLVHPTQQHRPEHRFEAARDKWHAAKGIVVQPARNMRDRAPVVGTRAMQRDEPGELVVDPQ